jgi:hypothetical protein
MDLPQILFVELQCYPHGLAVSGGSVVQRSLLGDRQNSPLQEGRGRPLGRKCGISQPTTQPTNLDVL